jgi:hypothetical protein
MNYKQILLSLVLLEFLAATIWAYASMGVVGAFAVIADNPATMLITFDLLIALVFSTVWMVSDAKKRGANPWPYLALTLATGSGGLLAYLIVRVGEPAPRAARVPVAA